jgi:hypothetical protein
MYKDKEKQKEANKEASRRYRQGMTQEGMTETPKCEGMTEYPGIIYVLTDRKQRSTLGKVVQAFKDSHHPEYAADVYVGVFGPSVLEAGDLLECTRNIPLPA